MRVYFIFSPIRSNKQALKVLNIFSKSLILFSKHTIIFIYFSGLELFGQCNRFNIFQMGDSYQCAETGK